MQAETRFKQKVAAFLKDLPSTWFVKIQQVVIRGTPDFLCCVRGSFVAMELKSSEKSVVSALQAFNLQEISNAGGIALVVTPENWDKTKQLLHDISAGIKRRDD